MAESIVQVTEGSGKKLHTFQRTIGANSVEDEVVIQGEPYLATYTVTTPITATSLATANSHVLQIMAGASLKVRIRRIVVYQSVVATAAAILGFGLYRLTTAGTGGTVVTPSPLDATDAGSGATAATLPGVKGTEGALIEYAAPYLIQTVGASTPFVTPAIVWDFDKWRSKPLTIPAGAANGIAIKNLAAAAGASCSVVVWFDEANF